MKRPGLTDEESIKSPRQEATTIYQVCTAVSTTNARAYSSFSEEISPLCRLRRLESAPPERYGESAPSHRASRSAWKQDGKTDHGRDESYHGQHSSGSQSTLTLSLSPSPSKRLSYNPQSSTKQHGRKQPVSRNPLRWIPHHRTATCSSPAGLHLPSPALKVRHYLLP